MPDKSFKITDFGVSKKINDIKSRLLILGTPPYLPPEISKYYDRYKIYL